MNAAQQRLNTERSEVLEHHEVVIESRVAAFNNSSGTSCRSIASTFSIQPRLHSVQKRIYPLKLAYLGLKIERSEILERCAAAFESREAAIEPLSP
ncbi:hypothetical protein [Fidelibacter multiformis]|uniref:hypothetical protein n=1 Tax=Fidelibacter multiformis TaxID=3377529 RepID=UPI0037DC7571